MCTTPMCNRRAADMASTLRAFEVGDADVGFLGAGLHRRRANAVDFRTDDLGFVVLRTGPLAAAWGAPGVAARLVAGLDPGRFAHLGLSPKGGGAPAPWGGPPAELLVDEQSAYFLEIARALSAGLSQNGHEIRPAPLPRAELRRRRDEGKFALCLDFVRRLGPSPEHALLGLLATADPKVADRPPRFAIVLANSSKLAVAIATVGRPAAAACKTVRPITSCCTRT